MDPASLLVLSSVVVALVAIYYPLIALDPILARDDVHTLAYLKKTLTLDLNHILVYQPLRDLSFWIDFWLRARLGWWSHHLTHLLIWIACVAIFWALLRSLLREKLNPLSRALWTAIFALHPVFVGSVAWISARKHLLAALFILAATWTFVESVKRNHRVLALLFVSWVFYFCSLLSHPIALLWPVWAGVYGWMNATESRARKISFAPVPVAAVAAVVNWLYYSGMYAQHTGAAKLAPVQPMSFEALSLGLLALGRYFGNLIFPMKLAASYSPGSWVNLLGLVALPILLYVFRSRAGARFTISWFLLFMAPLAPVVLQLTQVFVSDSYLISGAAGIFVLAAATFAPLSRMGDAILVFVAGFLAVVAGAQARTWTSDAELWTHSYHTEATPSSTEGYARILLNEGRISEAHPVLLQLKAWGARSPQFLGLYARFVYLDPVLSNENKIRLLEEVDAKNAWIEYYLGAAHAASGNFVRAHELMRQALDSYLSFDREVAVVAAEFDFICRKIERTDCERAVEELRRNGAYGQWDEVAYQARLKELLAPKS